jgi:hypothetical protein
MKLIQQTINEAYMTCGRILAIQDTGGDALASALDSMLFQFESGTLSLRSLCEKHRPEVSVEDSKPKLRQIRLTGKAEMNEYGWLHIELNTLLPHCRYRTPAWLTDTISRLLDDYEREARLPRFGAATLVIDEHCNVKSRTVFDPDNKGWKAIPNALKGRVIKDDDQFSLNIALISTKSSTPSCHIYLLPAQDTGDFFFAKYGGYPMFP